MNVSTLLQQYEGRSIALNRKLTHDEVENKLERFKRLTTASSTPVLLVISSRGGNWERSLDFIRAIKSVTRKSQEMVTALALGPAVQSSAAMIFISCPEGGRYITKNCTIRLEPPTFHLRFRARNLRSGARLPKTVARRIESKHDDWRSILAHHTCLSDEQIRKIEKDDQTPYNATQALTAGLADEIVEVVNHHVSDLVHA